MGAAVSAVLPLHGAKLAGRKGFQAVAGRCEEPHSAAMEERNRVLVELLPQVRYIALRIHERLPAHVAFADIYQMGVVGLIDALKKYDPRKRVQIQTYMKFRIRGAILDGLRALDWSPRELRKKARQIERAENGLRANLGRNPSEEEIARELCISLKGLQRVVGELRGLDLSSLQDIITLREDGTGQELCSRVASAGAEDPYHLCAKREKVARLAVAVKQLPEKEQQVLALYYFEELTMKEIGQAMSVGESRVPQIHSLAMVRLRSLLGPAATRSAASGPGVTALVHAVSPGIGCGNGRGRKKQSSRACAQRGAC